MATVALNHLPLIPLGAGDLIDRAVRLYRRHFVTLLRIAAPPVVISATGWVMILISWRAMVATPNASFMLLYILIMLAGGVLWVVGMVLNIIVMGGAARNLVTHLLWNEPVTARATYANVRSRFWGLLGATLLISVLATVLSGGLFYGWIIAIWILVIGAIILSMPGWMIGVVITATAALTGFGTLWLFFWIMGRFAYVPQVMLIEGRDVFDAITRSAKLARGNARRLMALILFSTFTAYSALMILVVPLGIIGYLNGVDPFSFGQESPAWYSISYQVLAQLSSILLAPVWMLGLSLMYVDERVRHEGYDVELMAARRLGDMPQLTNGLIAPITPAIVDAGTSPSVVGTEVRQRPGSMLGLS